MQREAHLPPTAAHCLPSSSIGPYSGLLRTAHRVKGYSPTDCWYRDIYLTDMLSRFGKAPGPRLRV